MAKAAAKGAATRHRSISSDLSAPPSDVEDAPVKPSQSKKRKQPIPDEERGSDKSASKRRRTTAATKSEATSPAKAVPSPSKTAEVERITVAGGKSKVSGAKKEEADELEQTVEPGPKAKRKSRAKVTQSEAQVNDLVSGDRAQDQAGDIRRSPAKVSSKATGCVKKEVEVKQETEEASSKTTQKKKKKKAGKAATAGVDTDPDVPIDGEEVAVKGEPEAEATQETPKPKRKRKTKEEKEAEAMPLAARTLNINLHIGAHVSASGGVHNSVTNAVHIGGNAFALFLKSQRKWENPTLKPEHASSFKSLCTEHAYTTNKHILPHGSYLVNLAAKDPAKATQAYTSFLDDLHRCESLGIGLYNFHPGNTNGEPRPEALARIADRLNEAHRATSTVITLLENMAAGNNTIGGPFSDLATIINLVHDKSRVGVCLDTCHAFAAGYDLRSPEACRATLQEFDDTIGAEYLKAVHLNDSKAPLGSRRDLHYNIGLGFLGLRSFHNVMNEPRFWGLPLVLETPIDHKNGEGKEVEDKGVWAREIKMLEGLVGMDVEGVEFRRLEGELWERGMKERGRLQEVVERKAAEAVKKAAKGGKKVEKKGKGKGKGKAEEGESSGLSDAQSD